MIPAPYNLPTGYRGDSYGPIAFYLNNPSGAIMLDGATGAAQVRSKRDRRVVLQWLSSDDSITISGNAVVLNTKVGADMRIPADVYDWDLQISSGEYTDTYLRGEFPVIQDITEI